MDQNHKITMFLPSLNDGGAERVFINLASDFLDKGYKVDLVLYKVFGPYLDQLPKGLTIHSLQSKTPLGGLWALIRFIRANKPLHVLSALPEANLLNIAARYLGGVKYRCLITEHTILSENLRIYKTYIFHNVKHFLVRSLYRFADKVIVVSHVAAQNIAHYCRIKSEKIAVVYNPVYDPAIEERGLEDPEHPWLPEDKGRREYNVLLSVGRFMLEKDHTTMLEAFDILRKRRAVKLIMLGRGPFENVARDKANALGLRQEDLYLGGFVDNPYAFMARSDVLVLHSTHEGFGNVLIEAMAVGTPVVSTKSYGGPAEILENGKWGPLPPAKDAEALANAIEQVLDHPPHSGVDYKSRAKDFSIHAASRQYLQYIFD